MKVENLLSHQFEFFTALVFSCSYTALNRNSVKQKQKLLQLKTDRHVDFANRKVHNFDRGRCFTNKNGKQGKFG